MHGLVPCCVSNLHDSMLSREIEKDPTCAHKMAMHAAILKKQVDLAVKHRLKRVWVSIRVFYAK